MNEDDYEVALDLSRIEAEDFEPSGDEDEVPVALPTVDDYVDETTAPPVRNNYPDFNPADTMVLFGPLGNYTFDNPRINSKKRFATRKSAIQYHVMKHGHVFESMNQPRMWMVRVPKPGKWPPPKREIR